MSKLSTRRSIVAAGLLASATLAVGAALIGGSRPVLAGEAGAAGAASFTINTSGQVTGASVAAATGKQGAAAGANNDASHNSAFALGSGGIITITTDTTTGYVKTIQDAADADVAKSQVNSMTADSVDIDATTGITKTN